jgi:hypothetical protein
VKAVIEQRSRQIRIGAISEDLAIKQLQNLALLVGANDETSVVKADMDMKALWLQENVSLSVSTSSIVRRTCYTYDMPSPAYWISRS